MGILFYIMLPRVKLLFISTNEQFYERYFQSILEPNRFLVHCATTLAEGKQCIEDAQGAIGSVFLDITDTQNQDPAETLLQLRSTYFPEIVLCICTKKENDPSFVLPIVDYMRSGAYGVLKLPTYDREILWIAKQTLTIYLSRKRVMDNFTHPDYTERMRQFYTLLLSRKQKGLPIAYKELELFFLPKHKDINLEEVLTSVKTPPIKEYKNTTILIAEDEVKTSQWYQDYFERNCYTVITANSGKQTLELLDTTDSISIVILDVELGDMTGNDLIPEIKKKHPKAEIIMVTAFSEFDLIINTLRLGAFDFLVKSETTLAVINQKIIQALHKRHFEDFFQTYLETPR